jgi:hypothetical protein
VLGSRATVVLCPSLVPPSNMPIRSGTRRFPAEDSLAFDSADEEERSELQEVSTRFA